MAAVVASATVFAGVGVFPIIFIAPKATDNAIPATVTSHNAHAVPSAGFLYYINYHHKDDVMI